MKLTSSKRTYNLDGQEVTQETLIKTAQHCICEQFVTQDEAFTDPNIAKAYMQVLIGSYEHEVFYSLWLNSQHCVITHGILFQGTVNYAAVYPREVIKAGLACNATAVIFAHNHPSGKPEPSSADINITRELRTALNLVDIKLLDHLIVGESVTSMAERGLL